MNSKLLQQPYPKRLMDTYMSAGGSAIEIVGWSLSLVLVNIFTNVLLEGRVGMLIKCASDTNMEGIEIRYNRADRIKIQNNLDMPQCWAKTNNMKCNKDKCRVLFLGSKVNYRNRGWRTCNLAAVDVKRPWGSFVSRGSLCASDVMWLHNLSCAHTPR